MCSIHSLREAKMSWVSLSIEVRNIFLIFGYLPAKYQKCLSCGRVRLFSFDFSSNFLKSRIMLHVIISMLGVLRQIKRVLAFPQILSTINLIPKINGKAHY